MNNDQKFGGFLMSLLGGFLPVDSHPHPLVDNTIQQE
jgi:hypothetical protein